MSQKSVVILVLALLIIIGIMMYLYFKSQQIKAQQQLEQSQIAAITGIQPAGGGGFGSFISSVIPMFFGGAGGQLASGIIGSIGSGNNSGSNNNSGNNNSPNSGGNLSKEEKCALKGECTKKLLGLTFCSKCDGGNESSGQSKEEKCASMGKCTKQILGLTFCSEC